MLKFSRYLFGSFIFNELFVNAVGLGRQLFLRRESTEILTCCPKLNVLFAELRLQEDTKGSFSIWGSGREEEDVLKTRGHIHTLKSHYNLCLTEANIVPSFSTQLPCDL